MGEALADIRGEIRWILACHSERLLACHSERLSPVILSASEESRCPAREILRFTQDDKGAKNDNQAE